MSKTNQSEKTNQIGKVQLVSKETPLVTTSTSQKEVLPETYSARDQYSPSVMPSVCADCKKEFLPLRETFLKCHTCYKSGQRVCKKCSGNFVPKFEFAQICPSCYKEDQRPCDECRKMFLPKFEKCTLCHNCYKAKQKECEECGKGFVPKFDTSRICFQCYKRGRM